MKSKRHRTVHALNATGNGVLSKFQTLIVALFYDAASREDPIERPSTDSILRVSNPFGTYQL